MSEYQGLDSQLKKGLADLAAAMRGERFQMINVGANIYRLDKQSGEIERFTPEDFEEEDFEEEEEIIEETEEEHHPKIPPPERAEVGVLRGAASLIRRFRPTWGAGSKSLSQGGGMER